MKTHAPPWFLIAVFLAVLVGPPVVQAVVEVHRGEWPSVLQVFSRRPTPDNLRGFERAVEDTSMTVRCLRPMAQALQFVVLHDAGEKALAGRNGWLFYQPGVRTITQRIQNGETTAKDAIAAIMRFRDDLNARGIHLLVIPAPNKESVYPDQLSPLATAPEQPPSAETRALMEQCSAAGVEVLNLFALYRTERRRSGAALYLSQDSHWTPEGMEAAAIATADRIVERGWLPRGTIPYQVRPAPLHEHGDLVKMIRSPQVESFVRPESIIAHQVVRADSGTLFKDDPAPEVLVLGDSFLRIYQREFPGAAGFVAHLARALRQPVGSIISDGGASTLVRQTLFRRPRLLSRARVIVWEFVERDIRLGMDGWQQVPLPPVASTSSRDPSE